MIFQSQTGSGVNEAPGADVTQLFSAAPGKVGTVLGADAGVEVVLVRTVLAAATDVTPGLAWQVDKDFNASLLTTALAVLQQEVMFGLAWAPATAAGTYWMWLSRSGHMGLATTAAAVAGGLGESTTTPGKLLFPAAPTVGSKAITQSAAYAANATFVATTLLNSPVLTAIPSVNDISVGATITGAGIPAGTLVGNIRRSGGGFAIDMVQSAALKTPQNATASASGVTVTATGVVPGNVMWPVLNKTN